MNPRPLEPQFYDVDLLVSHSRISAHTASHVSEACVAALPSQAEALPADARAGSVWALIENYFNANRGAKALPSALANGLDLLVVPAAQSSANSPKNKGGAEEKAPIKAQRSSDPATDSRKSSLDSITAMPATKKGGATAAGDTKSRSNDEPIDGEKVAATGGGMDGKVNQAAMTSSSAAPTSSPLPPTKPPCAPLPPLPVVVGLERKPGDPPSYMGGLTVVSLAPVHNSQQAPQGLLCVSSPYLTWPY